MVNFQIKYFNDGSTAALVLVNANCLIRNFQEKPVKTFACVFRKLVLFVLKNRQYLKKEDMHLQHTK